jgi:pimeloyl-ACP methyl ester carboxylesterase
MALLGVEGTDDTFKLPTRVHRVIEVIAESKRPSLPDDVRAIVDRLRSKPAHFTFTTGQQIVLGEWDFRRWVTESLDTVSEIDAMVAAIPAMLDGQFATLAQWALRFRISRPINLMNLAMDCASYGTAGRLARIRSESSMVVLGDVINFPLPDACDVPGLPRLPDQFRTPLQSNVRALLVSGTFDGRTPPQNAADVSIGLPRARSLVIEGASHGLFREQKALEHVLAFFRQNE